MNLRDEYLASDGAMWHEAFWANHYRVPEKFEPEDLVIDVGAHIGCFSRLCLCRGAKRVIAAEADVENWRALVANCHSFPEVQIVPRAVWRSDRLAEVISMRPANAAKHLPPEASMARVPDGLFTAEVETIGLDALIIAPVRLLKIDAESAEYPILYTSRKLGMVQAIALEYHSEPLREESGCCDRATPGHLADYLREQGFNVEWEVGKAQGLMFANR